MTYVYEMRSWVNTWSLSLDSTSSCAGTHLGICPSMGQKKPSVNVFPGSRELVTLLASHVARNTKDIAAGFVSGCARDHDSDTDVRVPARAPSESRDSNKPIIADDGRRRICKLLQSECARGEGKGFC